MKRIKKSVSIIGVIILVSIMLASCGKNGIVYNYESDTSSGSYQKSNTDILEKTLDSGGENKAIEERKIIKNVNITAETKEFDKAIDTLKQKVSELGGYIESSSISGSSIYDNSNIKSRTANFTVRIPVDNLDSYIGAINESEINVVSSNDYIEDVTDHYYDLDARLNSLKAEEQSLLEMLEQSKDLDYLIRLNERLSEIRYEIESYESAIKRYDSKIAYSTVKIYLNEVIDYTLVSDTPQNFAERFATAFKESWNNFGQGAKDFAIAVVYAFPTLLVLAVIALAVFFIVRASVKRSKRHPVSTVINNKKEQ